MTRDENDGRVSLLVLQLQSVDVRQLDIQDHASRHVGLRIREVLRSGTECDRAQIEARQELG